MKKILKGFSEKKDGSMYLPVPENAAHRKNFFEEQGISGRQIAIAQLVDGAHVANITPASPYLVPETDALVTKDSNIILALTGADCFPVYFEEKNAGIIGLAHCGWRGIVADIIGETLAQIVALGGTPARVVLTIGPGLCTRHFSIQEDILPSFAAYPEYVHKENGLHVDLQAIMRKQAEAGGVLTKNIIDSQECTSCLVDKYFSYRRDHPKPLEAQMAYIIQFPHRKF